MHSLLPKEQQGAKLARSEEFGNFTRIVMALHYAGTLAGSNAAFESGGRSFKGPNSGMSVVDSNIYGLNSTSQLVSTILPMLELADRGNIT